MSLQSTLKRLAKAVPVILANLPAIVAALKDVKDAVKKPKAPAAGAPFQGEAAQSEASQGQAGASLPVADTGARAV
jgi:hypothetical protein